MRFLKISVSTGPLGIAKALTVTYVTIGTFVLAAIAAFGS